MSWLTAIPLAIIALVVLYGLGGAIVAAAGARGKLFLVTAPATAVTSLSVFAVVFGVLGLPWKAWTAIAALVALAVVVWCARRLIVGRWGVAVSPRAGSLTSWVHVLALIFAATVISTQFLISYGDINNVSQTYDAPFHLNGIRYIIDTADGSSMHLTGLILPEGRSSFYPAGWHDLVSVVAMLMPAGGIIAAANVTNLVIAAVVWPVNVLVAVSVIAPSGRVALFSGAVLSTAFPAFPLGMIDYGVLYPFFLALAFLPAGIALGAVALGLARGEGFGSRPLQWLGVLAITGAMGFGQPSLVFAFGAFALVGVVAVGWHFFRDRGRAAVALWAIGTIVVVVGFGLLWRKIGALGFNAPWEPYGSFPEVVVDAFMFSRGDRVAAVALGLLVVVGLYAEVRRRRFWLICMWAISALLFTLSGALASGDLRNMLLGLFYKDTPRFEALLVPMALLVAVIGSYHIWDLLLQTRRRYSWSLKSTMAIGSALLALTFVATQMMPMREAVVRASKKYHLTAHSTILDKDERKLLDELDSVVPERARIAGSPWTGTSWAYALADRMVINPHFNASSDIDEVTINQHLADAATMPEVCDALRNTGVRYVLDFGVDRFGGRITVDSSYGYEGLVDLDDSGVVREVARVNDKVLYEITACGF